MQPPGQMRGQYQSQQQSQQQQQQPPQQAKLSLSDAIGLITLRLGRVETIVQNIQTGDGYENTGSGELPDNMRVIDESVFTSIVSRLDQLETGHKQVLVKLSQKPVSVSALVPVPAQSVPVPLPVPVQADERIPQLTETVTNLQSEISQLKDMLLKLQSFTMDTNQKLSDIIFKNNDQDNDVEDGGPLNICSDEDCVNIEHMNNPMMNLMQFIGSRGMPIQFEEGAENFNLKEYIQSELQTSSVTELEPENLVEELSEQ